MNWEWILGAAPLLLLLACPIAMFWMMRGMSHEESSGKTAQSRHDGLAAAPVETDEEIRALKERLARLEAQHQSRRVRLLTAGGWMGRGEPVRPGGGGRYPRGERSGANAPRPITSFGVDENGREAVHGAANRLEHRRNA